MSHPDAMDHTLNILKQNEFILKVKDNLKDYLSCKIVFSTNRKKAWLGQPHLLTNMENIFRNWGVPWLLELQVSELFVLPMIIKIFHMRIKSNTLWCENATYLVKHSSPDIANMVRESSKVLGVNKAVYKEMHWIIKYVLDTWDLGLKIETNLGSNETWELICFSDSEWLCRWSR